MDLTTTSINAPHVDADSAPFWEAADRRRLALQGCRACGRPVHPPGPGCPRCGSADLEWAELPEPVTGTVYSYVVVHRAFSPSFAEAVPYVVGLVDLDARPGARLTATVAGWGPDDAAIGVKVTLDFVAADGGRLVPLWAPDGAGPPGAGSARG